MEEKITFASVIKEFTEQLTNDELQLVKDTIKYGSWGDCAMEFLDGRGNPETVAAWGYCTNDAHRAGNFKGRRVTTMFQSIYRKLCPEKGMGRQMTQIHDWWEDGSGDMLFLRDEFAEEFEKWANGTEQV